ncbi:Prolyl 3-hydroxylase 2 [Hondaea fermentalgiana]|uniref:Prolyl 3-hydroxylase 2 n=1 Tax=Hondaea fermentalgiana TaxID=2315210 RepID=A0A2R5G4R6_9STRA|nr:Prolyl 3-hydroxylase 2 [Hondaea fermentalgiana]|eukprot:GBG24778.1 Prolyl 3-hydroxylase 2 [Hondaea fermentalgiana]
MASAEIQRAQARAKEMARARSSRSARGKKLLQSPRSKTSIASMAALAVVALAVTLSSLATGSSNAGGRLVTADVLETPWREAVQRAPLPNGERLVEGCHVPETWRHVEDAFISDEEIDILLRMVEKGMASSRGDTGGPTILDVNGGFMKDGMGVQTIYGGDSPVSFTSEEYKVYARMFDRIRERIMEVNNLETLYFTAPTFVARIVGNESWTPLELHDEYWHPHVDKDNTPHYDMSGLVYLTTHGEDFDGGEFVFLDEGNPTVVRPRRGRFITFSSGQENPHRFTPVTRGTRYAFSMWFSCDKAHQFKTFLDGKVHRAFHRDEL